MSKLNNAPLVEVVFELRWRLNDQQDLQAVQYLYGDLYNEVKEKYKFRESNFPPDIPQELTINKPVYRYRAEKNSYPLIQLGPGTFSFNASGVSYEWTSFYEEVKMLVDQFFRLHDTGGAKKYSPGLIYLDFFPIDFQNTDALEFLNENLNIKLEQSFFETPGKVTNVKTGFAWQTSEGDLSVDIQKGVYNGQEGLLLKTNIKGKAEFEEPEEMNNSLVRMHEICSRLFKEIMTSKAYKELE